MHNKINLVTLLKSGFLSIIFIFSNVIFAAESNKYLENIAYPAYDPGNSDHVLIRSNTDWSKINSSAHYYYVNPGDYRGAGRVSLRAKGTSSQKRYIILNDNQQTHPAKLQTSKQANVWLSFSGGGSYWVIDRISSISVKTVSTIIGELYLFTNSASNNILNRLYITDYAVAVLLLNGSHNNTIQNSRIEEMTLAARKADKVAVALASNGKSNIYIFNTKILQNEIVNANDGIQLILSSGVTNLNYDGTIINRNLIWLTPDIYVNAIGGSPNIKGLYAYAENAIDLKAGSKNADNPVVITNNIMWGFRKNAKDGDPGDAMTIHHGFSNLVFEDNILFDSHRGIGSSAGGIYNSSFKRNIIYECNKHSATNYAVYLYGGGNLDVENNIIVNIGSGYGINIQNIANSTFKKNVLIASGTASLTGSIEASDNYYYNTSNRINGIRDISYTNTSASNMNDFIFTYDNYTNNPKQKTLFGVVTTASSPHTNIIVPPNSLAYSFFGTSNDTTNIPSYVEATGPWVINPNSKELR